ncbi:AAA family ATPase [Candidatus Bathyarchaeota archaeon]|nr:AAA family ATPase [Candidatus Bathyarchaeota archaeon]
MILTKVKLENFISHKKTEIDLGYGINVILGPNGAGKTAVLDAISFALFNDCSNRGKREKLINDKANKCQVGVSFTEGGISYEADWSMARKGSARGNLFRMMDEKRTLIVSGGERSVVPEIQEILGFDKNMFMQSVYVRQGEIEKLVTATPGERKELISKLLGIQDLDRAWNDMKSVVQVYHERQLELATELKRKEIVETSMKSYEAESKGLIKSLSGKRKELVELESLLGKLERNLSKMKADREQFEKYDKDLAILETEITNAEKKSSNEAEELRKAEEAFQITRKLEDSIVRLPILEEYVNYLTEKEKQELRLVTFQDRLSDIVGYKKTLSDAGKGHELYLLTEEALRGKNKERKKLEGAPTALLNAKNRFEEGEGDENNKKLNLAKELAKCSKALGETVSVVTVGGILEQKRKEYIERDEKFNSEIETTRGTLSAVEQRIAEVEENLSKFSSSSDIKNCPTCETILSPTRVTELTEKYALERSEKEVKKTSLETRLREVREARDQFHRRMKRIDSIDLERIETLESEWKNARDRIGILKTNVVEDTGKAQSLDHLDEEIERLEHERQNSEECFREFDNAKSQLERLPSEEEIENQIRPVEASIQNYVELVEASSKKLGYLPKEPKTEIQKLRGEKEMYDQSLVVANKMAEYESRLQGTRTYLSNCVKRRSDLRRTIEKIGYNEKEHARIQEESATELKCKNDVENEIAREKQAKLSSDKEAKKCKEELENIKKKEVEKKRVEGFINTLNQIREAYGRDGIQKVIRARARPLLESSARDLFERFDLAYSDIRIDDDYNLSVSGVGEEKDIDQISGGERVALAIAIRLAIAQVLSGKIETIIMDEPTTHLDDQRRKELVSILSSFFREGGRIIPQMLIITHHPEIEDVADTVYSVRKEEGFSIAEKTSPA